MIDVAKKKRELEIRIEVEKLTSKLWKHEEENKILFFGIRDAAGSARHADCCKLFRGPNEPQGKLLEAWKDRKFKIFTY